MNATKWITLTEFIKHLGKEGLARVDDTEKGWFISWVDSSPAAMARQEAILKKERQDTDDEQRQRKMLAEQIARAKAEKPAAVGEGVEGEGGGPTVEQGLVRPMVTTGGDGSAADNKVKLAFSFGAGKKAVSPPTAAAAAGDGNAVAGPSTGSSSTAAPLAGKAPVKLSFNPLKRPAPATNVFKAASKASSSSSAAAQSSVATGAGKMSATELLMKEDAERKRRLAEGSGGGRGGGSGFSFGGGAGGGGGPGKRLKM